jgi:sulfoxide reductase heme-binding subunit YedZ
MNNRWRIFRLLLHIAAIFPLVWLLLAALADRLTYNPVQYLEQRTGDYALILLLASLACTPAAILSGVQQLRQFRKPLGLYAAAYAAFHVGLFIWLDYGANWQNIFQTLGDRISLWFGLAALVLLLALAVTSIRSIHSGMKTWWERVHKLAYLAAALVATHYALTVKGNLMNLSGKVTGVIVAIIVLTILLFIRLPAIQTLIGRLRGKIQKS